MKRLGSVAEVLEPLKSGVKLKLGASTRSYEAKLGEVSLGGGWSSFPWMI